MAEESLASLFECLCGRRPERYWLERYVALNHLYGYVLWSHPKDSFPRQLIRAVAASRLIVTIADYETTEYGGPADSAAIQAAEFSDQDVYRQILDLAGTNSLENLTLATYDLAYRAGYILQFFFGYSSHKSTRRQDRPSLNKAFAFIASGQFPETKTKTTRMKDLWSTYKTALPLVYAMQYAGLAPDVVGPFDEDGIFIFLEEQNKEPEITKHLVEMAASVQTKFISLLDDQTKKKKIRWLKYPENLSEREFGSLRMTQKKANQVRGLFARHAQGRRS
jgi:hypothetical protein